MNKVKEINVNCKDFVRRLPDRFDMNINLLNFKNEYTSTLLSQKVLDADLEYAHTWDKITKENNEVFIQTGQSFIEFFDNAFREIPHKIIIYAPKNLQAKKTISLQGLIYLNVKNPKRSILNWNSKNLISVPFKISLYGVQAIYLLTGENATAQAIQSI